LTRLRQLLWLDRSSPVTERHPSFHSCAWIQPLSYPRPDRRRHRWRNACFRPSASSGLRNSGAALT